MDRRQKKRLLIFLFIPLLAVIPFLTDDTVIRVAAITMLVVYVAFIIFLRDSVRTEENEYKDKGEESDLDTIDEHINNDSFEIISKNKNVEVITADNYVPEIRINRSTLKPHDLKEKFEEVANEQIPDEIGHGGQFTFVLEKILISIKEAYSIHTAIFFWYDKKKEKLSIERFASDSKELTRRKLEMQDDILGRIIQKEEPELLSDISPVAEADVIRYYGTTQGIRSFVGVPLFFDKSLVGILAIDSKAEEAFSFETIFTLGRFVRLITILISLFEERHHESISQRRLKGLLGLIGTNSNFENEQDVFASLENTVKQIIHWDAFTFVFYNPDEKKFKTSKIVNRTSLKYVGEHLEIQLNGTLVGKSIVSGMPVKIDDTSAVDYIRFSKSEDVSFDGSFMAIPLVYDNQNFGVLCFESLKKNAYSNDDIQFLKNATNILAFVINTFSTQKLLKSLLAVDIETRALNEVTFKERLLSDLLKSHHLNIDGALALIRIDDFLEQESLFDGNPFPKVLASVSEAIEKEVSPLHLYGRLSQRVFAVYFFNQTAKDVYLWAEKLRVKIARKPIAVVSKQTTYTVSIGVASATKKVDVEEVIYNADLALQKAIERGGNAVRSIN